MGNGSLSELIKAEMSQYGIEVASEGSASMQLSTPGVVYDIGAVLERIEDVAPSAVVDVTAANGVLEILITWPSGGGDCVLPADTGGVRPWHMIVSVVGISLSCLLPLAERLMAVAPNITV